MRSVVELALLGIAVACAVGRVWNQIKFGKGIGLRFIQYIGLTVLVPFVAILSLEHRISPEMTGAIAAAARWLSMLRILWCDAALDADVLLPVHCSTIKTQDKFSNPLPLWPHGSATS